MMDADVAKAIAGLFVLACVVASLLPPRPRFRPSAHRGRAGDTQAGQAGIFGKKA